MKRISLIFFLLLFPLYGEKIDIVSYSPLLLPKEQLEVLCPSYAPLDTFPMLYKLVREKFDVKITLDLYKYVKKFKKDSSHLKKIIFFDYCEDPKLFELPKEKLVLFKWEAIKILPKFYEPYSVVYTWDDDLVDGVKFFKFYYPALLPMIKDLSPFEEKKLCTLIATNWVKIRREIVDFFDEKPEGEFEFYGIAEDPKLSNNKMFKGSILGYHSGSQKIATLSNYLFSICFENTQNINGYITEKIFCCFAAGCVPIYWGAENIDAYIPKGCFIDYRQFQDNEEMYQFIKTMPKETYYQYIENIQNFLESEEAKLFSPEYFDKILYEAAKRK